MNPQLDHILTFAQVENIGVHIRPFNPGKSYPVV